MPRPYGPTTLPSGQRVTIRLPHRFDADPARGLCLRIGIEPDDVALARILRFDPRRRCALVATVLVDRADVLVGLGIIDRFADDAELVLADEAAAPGLRTCLEDALRGQARRSRRIA